MCTLATCKPKIRGYAKEGEHIVGTGSKTKGRDGHLIFWMRISKAMTFDDYWKDPAYELKKPDLRGSKMRWFGDNIYHRGRSGIWQQAPSHHSMPDGAPNLANVRTDTSHARVLLGTEFIYWGGNGPEIPQHFRAWKGAGLDKPVDLRFAYGHKADFPAAFVDEVVVWLQSFKERGLAGRPGDWPKRTVGRHAVGSSGITERSSRR